MFKKLVAVFTAVFLMITFVPSVLIQKAYAYQNNSYFNDLRVGLTSMSATTIRATLNGEYSINGQAYPSGTILNMSINGTSISLNGTLLNQINIVPNGKSNLLTITTGTVSNRYMGSFLIRVLDGKLLPINFIDMENYLKGVVGYEMSDYFPLEALKAQAVAARNYALSKIGFENAKGYDFDDTIFYQVYKGYNPTYTRVITAVEQTAGEVLLHNGRLVEALYSAWHGGVSEDSENVWGNFVPYLRSAQDSFENDPWPNGNRVLTNAQIQSTLVTRKYLSATDTFVRLDLNSITRYKSGRVSNINIIYRNSIGTELVRSVIRDNTRTFLGLPSNMYTVTYDASTGAYTFTGRGNGHGLGMSQIGAKNRASAGQTHEQILKFYFQNSYLHNLIAKASLSQLSISSSTTFAGEKISFIITAAGGNGYGYLYKFVIRNGSNVVTTRDYSSEASYELVPEAWGSYTVEAFVKDKFSQWEYDDVRTASFTVYEKVALGEIGLNKKETIVGQAITATANTQGGSGAYLYKYEVLKEGISVGARDFSSDKQLVYIPVEAGTYTVNVYIKDVLSTKSFDFSQSTNFTVYNKVTLNSINADSSEAFIGDSVNLSAIISGGSGGVLSYKYVIVKDGQTVLTKDFSEDSKFSYVPESAGSYEAVVYVADSVSENSYDAEGKVNFVIREKVKLLGFAINKDEVLVNDRVAVSSVSSSVNSLYKYRVSLNGNVVTTRDYSEISSFEFSPVTEGSYSVEVFVKDKLSKGDFDDRGSLIFKAHNPQLGNINVTGYLFEGKRIDFNASSIGASSYGFSYRYEVLSGGRIIASNSFSTASNFTFTPAVAGEYTVNVYGKDNLSKNNYDSLKEFKISVASKPLYLATLPLRQGMSGNDVTSLQNALISLGYNVGKELGTFGTQTKNAVTSFQRSRGLVADGIVGNITYGALNDALIEKSGIKNLVY